MPKQQRRTFTSEFQKQMVQLYENGKPRAAIVEEYDLTASALDRWIKQAQTTGSFKEKDNPSSEENELIALRKENQRLKMENDILKQAALIMGRKQRSSRAIGINTRYQQCATSCQSQEVRFITKRKNQPKKMTSPKRLWTSSTRIEKPTALEKSKSSFRNAEWLSPGAESVES